jgi:hypothetical protein
MRKFQNAQNPTENFQNNPRGTSSNAQNLIRNFQNSHNPMRNFQRCKKSHKKLPKILWRTSKIAQYPIRIFQDTTIPSSWDFVHFWKFLMAKHTRVPNTDRVDAEEADHSICLAKMSLIRTKPDHFYDMIWFFTYILS